MRRGKGYLGAEVFSGIFLPQPAERESTLTVAFAFAFWGHVVASGLRMVRVRWAARIDNCGTSKTDRSQPPV